ATDDAEARDALAVARELEAAGGTHDRAVAHLELGDRLDLDDPAPLVEVEVRAVTVRREVERLAVRRERVDLGPGARPDARRAPLEARRALKPLDDERGAVLADGRLDLGAPALSEETRRAVGRVTCAAEREAGACVDVVLDEERAPGLDVDREARSAGHGEAS